MDLISEEAAARKRAYVKQSDVPATSLDEALRVPQAILDFARNQAPVRRLGTPDDIAAACAYLVSEEASFLTGQILSPNGGSHTW